MIYFLSLFTSVTWIWLLLNCHHQARVFWIFVTYEVRWVFNVEYCRTKLKIKPIHKTVIKMPSCYKVKRHVSFLGGLWWKHRARRCVRQWSPLALQKRKLLRSAQDLRNRSRFSNPGLVSPLYIVAFLTYSFILLYERRFHKATCYRRQLNRYLG